MYQKKFDKLFKLIMQEYSSEYLNNKYGEYNNPMYPEFVILSVANIVDITKQMFDYVGIDISKPVYDVTGYSNEIATDPSNPYNNELFYTGNFIKITNNLKSAEKESNEIMPVIINDDGTAMINVEVEDINCTKAHILYDLHNHEIKIFSIK